MARILTGSKDLSYRDGDEVVEAHVQVADAHRRDVLEVLNAAPEDADGHARSQWVWIRFPNGDLVLATYPQDDTYFGVEQGVAEAFEAQEEH